MKNSCCTVTVKIKNDEQKFSQKFLCYEPINVCNECVELSRMVRESTEAFKGDPEEIRVKIDYQWS